MVAILAIVLIVPNMLSKSKKAGTIDVIVEDVNKVDNVINSNPDESTEDNNESSADTSGNQQ